MKYAITMILILFLTVSASAQKFAITCEGEKVILNADGTWKKADGGIVNMPGGTSKARYRILDNSSAEILKHGRVLEKIKYFVYDDTFYSLMKVEDDKYELSDVDN